MMEPILKSARIARQTQALNLPQRQRTRDTLAQRTPAPRHAPEPHHAVGLEEELEDKFPAPPPTLADPLLTASVRNSLSPTPLLVEDTRAEEETEQQAQAIFAQARDEGYAAGLADAAQKIRQEVDQALAQIATLLTGLGEIQASLYQEIEDNAVEVVFTALVKILGQAAADQQLSTEMVRSAVAQIQEREQLTVRVATSDYAVIQAALQQSAVSAELPHNLTIVADKLVDTGGCLIESTAGNLDARLEIQLQRLKEILLSVRHG